MEGQLILGIIIAVLALFGPMFWFGYRQGMMSAEITALKNEVCDARKDIRSIREALYRRGIAELAGKEWGHFEP